jgi:hypothetical protein
MCSRMLQYYIIMNNGRRIQKYSTHFHISTLPARTEVLPRNRDRIWPLAYGSHFPLTAGSSNAFTYKSFWKRPFRKGYWEQRGPLQLVPTYKLGIIQTVAMIIIPHFLYILLLTICHILGILLCHVLSSDQVISRVKRRIPRRLLSSGIWRDVVW